LSSSPFVFMAILTDILRLNSASAASDSPPLQAFLLDVGAVPVFPPSCFRFPPGLDGLFLSSAKIKSILTRRILLPSGHGSCPCIPLIGGLFPFHVPLPRFASASKSILLHFPTTSLFPAYVAQTPEFPPFIVRTANPAIHDFVISR